MPILVVQGGTTKPVTRAYQRVGSAPKEILLGQIVTLDLATSTLTPVTFYDRYLTPPTGLRGVSATNSSGQLAWNATPLATGYQVLQRRSATDTAPVILPAPTTWTSQLSLNVVGLAERSSYTFTVRARRFAADGTELISPESNAVTLNTGYSSVLKQSPGAVLLYITPYRSDTWTQDYGWGGSSGGPDVLQGYLSAKSRNAKGCVAYTDAFTKWRSGIWAIDSSVDLNAVVFNDARIEKVHRRSGGGSGTPAVDVYAAWVTFSGEPARLGGASGFQAPPPNADKTDLNPAGLLSWVQHWCTASIPNTHNGLMLNRNDGGGNATVGYNGYCIFQNATGGDIWRLKVWCSWSYSIPGQAPSWSTTSA